MFIGATINEANKAYWEFAQTAKSCIRRAFAKPDQGS